MELKILGSSSKGNCYILDNGKEALILEAGVCISDVKKALGFNLRKVVGCLVTHEHSDHSKYIDKMVNNGFYTLALPQVWEMRGVGIGRRAIALKPYKGYRLGNFKVLPFPASHDVPCVGFHIMHPECGRLLFLTDSCECLEYYPDLSHLLIECNYSTPDLIDAINDGRTLAKQMQRLPQSHMELQQCKAVLRKHDLSKVQNIVLLHLSEQNSNRERFVSEIERQTGCVVYAAGPNLTIDITKY